jgi:hypothetical protein
MKPNCANIGISLELVTWCEAVLSDDSDLLKVGIRDEYSWRHPMRNTQIIASNIIKHGSTQQLIGHIIAIRKKLEEQNPIKI